MTFKKKPYHVGLLKTSDNQLNTGNAPTTAVLNSNTHQQVSQNSSSGTFRLVYKGEQTAPIAWDATDVQLQTALWALATIQDDVNQQADITVGGTVTNRTVALTRKPDRALALLQLEDVTVLSGAVGVPAMSATPVNGGLANGIPHTNEVLGGRGGDALFAPNPPVPMSGGGWSGSPARRDRQ